MLNNQSELKLEFFVGRCNGNMHMKIFENSRPLINCKTFDDDNFVFVHTITWPCSLKIILSNKDLSCDTKVDADGKILADKYIKLQKITVDRAIGTQGYLNSLVLDTGKNKVTGSYWGFNGIVNLDFGQTDSFMWHLAQRVDYTKSYVVNHNKI